MIDSEWFSGCADDFSIEASGGWQPQNASRVHRWMPFNEHPRGDQDVAHHKPIVTTMAHGESTVWS
jgi:hypothetical protein